MDHVAAPQSYHQLRIKYIVIFVNPALKLERKLWIFNFFMRRGAK